MEQPEKTYAVPYVVSAVFADGNDLHQIVTFREAHTEAIAASLLVAEYYQSGGKLPLMVVFAEPLKREVAELAIKVYEAQDAARKAASEKTEVVKLVPRDVPHIPGLGHLVPMDEQAVQPTRLPDAGPRWPYGQGVDPKTLPDQPLQGVHEAITPPHTDPFPAS